MVGLIRSLDGEAWASPSPRRAHSRATPALVLETVRDPDALGRLEPEWRALMAAASPCPTLYQSFEWASACAGQLRQGVQLCILIARDRGRLVALAPLAIDRRLGLAAVGWLGGSLTIYGDVLAERSVDVSAWLGRAFAELAARGDAHCVMLDNVRADARIAPFLSRAGLETGRKLAPWIDMRGLGSFGAWKARQSRNTRRGRARRLKQLEAAGTVSFAFERAGSGAAARVARLLSMKRAWAEKREVISRTIWDRGFEAIVRALASRDSRLDARFSTLMLDGRPIAVELGFVSGGVYVSYLGAYDPAFETFSPGLLQLERTIEACFAEGLDAFDLQPPDDAYKQGLACEATMVTSHALPLTALGHLQSLVAQADVVGLGKAALRQMPAGCRQMACSALQVLRRRETGDRSVRHGTGLSHVLKRALVLLSASGAVAVAIAD